MTNLLKKQSTLPTASGSPLRVTQAWGQAGPTPAGWAATALASAGMAPKASRAGHPVSEGGGHPLEDARHNRRLIDQENEIKRAFADIETVMADIGAHITGEDAASEIQAIARARLGFTFPEAWLAGSWSRPVNLSRLFAYSVFKGFERLAARRFDRAHAEMADGEPAPELIRRWGFHAIDITPCADGRMAGVVDFILRVPPTVVTSRRSFAGASFDVEQSLRDWADVELRRHRDGVPNPAEDPTRYLKIGVYHGSSSDPSCQGCAAHGSDERKASQDLLDRLNALREAVETSYGDGATVATLLVGVDTDTDAIKVHVPDASGAISLERFIDNAALYEQTRGLARESAKDFIRTEVARVMGVAADDPATEGMRWFVGYLLKNNIAQIDYVRAYHAGRYPDLGHTERFITVGDSFDDVQMRNLSYQAQMATVEEGARDMDVGIKVFTGVNLARDLPIPVIVHFQYDGRVPGARDRAVARGRRLEQAIRGRYTDLVNQNALYTFVAVRDMATPGDLELVDGAEFEPAPSCSCEHKG